MIANLDKLKKEYGIQKFRVYIDDLFEKDDENLIELINYTNISFGTFFIIKPYLENENVFTKLNSNIVKSIKVVNQIINRDDEIITPGSKDINSIKDTISILQWIVESGILDDGLSEDYDKIVELAAILLTIIYKDNKYLKSIIDTMFIRYRKGHFMYHLAWAFFQSRDLNSLQIIAQYLRSNNEKDIQLALKLLNFITDFDLSVIEKDNRYLTFINWIEENKSFLFSTGESFQQCCEPRPYAINYEAKYLCKPISRNDGRLLQSLTDIENDLIREFSKLDDNTKTSLANFSYKIYNINKNTWWRWINNPINIQVKIVKNS